jgi:hypothetical protein
MKSLHMQPSHLSKGAQSQDERRCTPQYQLLRRAQFPATAKRFSPLLINRRRYWIIRETHLHQEGPNVALREM